MKLITVEKLIEELQKVEDKTLPVVLEDCDGFHEEFNISKETYKPVAVQVFVSGKTQTIDAIVLNARPED